MAFGALRGSVLTGVANSITNPFSATGSVNVAVGDLIVAVVAEQTNLTVTTVTDNLGNTYNAVNAGTDAGTITGRAYYSRVTMPGTLTSVNAAATASSDNVAMIAAAFEGQFVVSPLDAQPANNNNTDNTTPFACPPTGTLAQADELVIAWMSGTSGATWLATAPNIKAGDAISSGNVADLILGYQVVASTGSVTPNFSGTAPSASVQGTMSFKKDTAYVPPHRMFAVW